jgi:MarR family transcriptional regulator, organic hydroperoxide resistance regulator
LDFKSRTDQSDSRAPDYSAGLGGAAIGARLRRLSDRIDRDAARVYAALGVRFEQRWMGVLSLLAERGAMAVGDLAERLRISHPSVSQTRRSLIEAGIIAEQSDPRDGRRRTLHLTPEGAALVARLRPVWSALEQAGEVLNREAGNAVLGLDKLEAALDDQSLERRVEDIMKGEG